MDKSPNAFRTISEVATWLETPAHVLRFWESRFPELKPVKRAGGRRYYRPEDMRLLGGIKHLLHTEGHTIKSVQDRIKSEGIGDVAELSPPLESPAMGIEVETANTVHHEPESAVQDVQAPPAAAAEVVTEPAEPAFALETAGALPDPAPTEPAEAASAAAKPTIAAPVAAEPEVSPQPEHAKDDGAPPIGFFFDDSDDAEPAEAQSGTFSPLTQPEGEPAQEEPAVQDAGEEPVFTPKATTIEAVANNDPDDDTPGLVPVLSMPARLRALAASDISDEHRTQIAGLHARLKGMISDRP
ncbi:MerR family transcriptional regulator [Rhodobacteraceae bacterium SC52]|nr:MerR family transcriptional regulator [Rhodobacteraceae bacterium SC52]